MERRTGTDSPDGHGGRRTRQRAPESAAAAPSRAGESAAPAPVPRPGEVPGARGGALLETLRAAGAPVSLGDLAAALIASPTSLAPPLARRVVGSALGRPPETLADPLVPEELRRAEQTPAAPLEEAVFTVIDLETTGLSSRQAGILEIGAVRVRGLELEVSFETLVRPEGPLPSGIIALTGISPAMVADAPSPRAALGALRRWLDEAPGAPFVAHNARFDEGFVRRGFARHGLPPVEEPVLCTCKLARRLAPGLGRFGLDRVAGGFGIEIHARHRALGDARAAAEVLIHLIRRAREQWGASTIADLLELQARSPRALRAPRPPGRDASGASSSV